MALEIEDGTIKQTVYLQNCSGKASRTVLQVKSKVNSIMIDGCSKTSLVVHRCLPHALCCVYFLLGVISRPKCSVLASIEAVNSKNLEIQVNGPCPTMTLDNVNGCQIYLSEENQNVQIFTSKCRRVLVLRCLCLSIALIASVLFLCSYSSKVLSMLFFPLETAATPKKRPFQSSTSVLLPSPLLKWYFHVTIFRYVSIIKGGKLTTEPVAHVGA